MIPFPRHKHVARTLFYPLFLVAFFTASVVADSPRMSPHTFMKHLEKGMKDASYLADIADMYDYQFFGHVGLEIHHSLVWRHLTIIQDLEKNLKVLSIDAQDLYQKGKQSFLKRLSLVHKPDTLNTDDIYRCREDLELYFEEFLKKTLGRIPFGDSIKEKLLKNQPLTITERARLYMLFPHRSWHLIAIPEVAVLPLEGSDHKIILMMVEEDTGVEVQTYLWDPHQANPEQLVEIRQVRKQAQATLFMQNPETGKERFTWDVKKKTLHFPGLVWEQKSDTRSTSCTLTYDDEKSGWSDISYE